MKLVIENRRRDFAADAPASRADISTGVIFDERLRYNKPAKSVAIARDLSRQISNTLSDNNAGLASPTAGTGKALVAPAISNEMAR